MDRLMKDADIKIGYISSSGDIIMEDHFAHTPFGHREDSEIGGSEDLLILGGEEKNGSTTIRFQMPLNSGDDKDQILQPGDRVKLEMSPYDLTKGRIVYRYK